MKKEFFYEGNFTKADIVEIYCKAIANLGPANILFVKDFSYTGNIGKPLTGIAHYTASGYLRGLHGYIAVQVITCQDPPTKCQMERATLGCAREIELQNIEGKTRAIVVDSARGIQRVKKVLDEVLS
jgi:hypothetical protein